MTNASEQMAHEEPEFEVVDKRPFTQEGELTEAGAQAILQERLAEAEKRAEEAERKMREVSEKFSQAQKQVQEENAGMRQRLQRNFEQRLETAKGDIISSLLDSLDNLKRAVAAAEKSDSRESEFRSLVEGVRATCGLFEGRMREHGLATVASEGQEFNPEFHEAVEIVAVAPEHDNKVVAEFQPGYKFGEKLLRPARVRVGRAN